MIRSLGAPALAVALVACRSEPPPVEPPAGSVSATASASASATVSGSGTKEAPFVIPASGSVRIPVRASWEAAGGFRLAEQNDVVLTFEGKGISYTDPAGVTGGCSRSPCVIPSAMVGAYRLSPDTRKTIGVEVLPPRAREPLVKSGKMTLTPKAVEGDPRGRVAEASLDVAAPGAKLSFRVRPVVKGKPETKPGWWERTEAVGLRVYGPKHTVTMSMHEHDKPGWIAAHFDAEPGSYVLRLEPKPLQGLEVQSVELEVEKIEAVAPDNVRSIRPLKPGLDLPLLAVGDKRDIDSPPEPARAETWIAVEPASESEWSWARKDAEVMATPTRWNWCFGSPCFGGVGGSVALVTSRLEAEAAIDVEVRRLPTPSPTTLPVDRSADVLTERPAPDDPRGPFHDFAIDVKADDAFLMTVKVTGDFKSPPLKELIEIAPRLEVISGDELLEGLNPMPVSDEQLRVGVAYLRLQAKKPGRVVVRLDGLGRAPARNAGVLLERTKRIDPLRVPGEAAD